MALTPEQEAALAAFRQRTGRGPLEAPTQRLRTAAQGLTFNLADEAEAAVVSAVTGRPREEVEQEIRQKISAYQMQSPTESRMIEFGGAVIPSAIASAVTKNPAPITGVFSKFLPNLSKVIGIGGVEGAVQTVGSMEGPIRERFEQPEQIAMGAGLGAVTAGGLYTGGTGALKGVEIGTEALRFISGSRARNAVNNEIQRIASEAGIDAAEAERRLLNGELIAEDPNVAEAIRPYIGRGEASTRIRGTMTERPAVTRRTAFQAIRSGLAAGLDRNIYRHMRASNDLLRKLERDAYKSAFETVQDAPQPVVDQMYEVISRFPGGGTKLKEAFKSETGREPFFVIDDFGRVSFRMLPTMRDAEQLRRIVSDEGRRLRIAGGADATIGVNLGDAESRLRTVIDDAAPDIGVARENARLMRARNENYKQGTQANSRTADEIEVEFNDVLNSRNPGLIQAYRLGYLQNLQARIEGGNKASQVARLTDPESKEGRIFRIIYPGDLQDAALAKLGVAKQAQAASNKLLTGSATAPTLGAAQREGMISQSVSTAGLAADAMRGDVFAAANMLDRIVSQFRPGLTDTDRSNIARVLLSNDPQVVRTALTSREGLRSLQPLIIALADAPAMTAALAGTTLAPEIGQ